MLGVVSRATAREDYHTKQSLKSQRKGWSAGVPFAHGSLSYVRCPLTPMICKCAGDFCDETIIVLHDLRLLYCLHINKFTTTIAVGQVVLQQREFSSQVAIAACVYSARVRCSVLLPL